MLTKDQRKEIEEHLLPYLNDPDECRDLYTICEGCGKKFLHSQCKDCKKFALYLELEYLRWCKSWEHGDDMC